MSTTCMLTNPDSEPALVSMVFWLGLVVLPYLVRDVKCGPPAPANTKWQSLYGIQRASLVVT
jgi:hypothetical protein